MVWIRAAAAVANLTVRRNLARRSFHSSFLRRSPPVPRPVPLSRLTDSFLDGTSTVYLEELQRAWESDPRSVDDSWDHFFRNFTGAGAGAADAPSPSSIQDSMRLLLLIRAYQAHGHRKAKLDPLSLDQAPIPAELDPALYGFTDADLDREFYIGVWRMSGFLSENNPTQTLRSVIARLEHAYCGSIGYEYMHIADRDKCNWLRHRIESSPTEYSADRRAVILDRLAWSSLVEQFFHTKWPSAKRFGIEGAEVIIPAMEQVIETAASLGVESVVIGTGHRGRISVLANIAGVPFPHIFTLFGGGGAPPPEAGYAGTGDVKHHIGASHDRQIGGKMVHLSVLPNPSHLEAVNPVVLGKTRAKQYYAGDTDRSRIMPLMLQGDGSFAGQGVVAEALHLSGLRKYGSGGEVHIVNNNQVAFTTDPRDGRASHYCTDVAKALDAPVFHVNGDDVEAVIRACELATEWRQTFHTDVVVDIFCLRRLGHNEIDEPFFTQPKKYQVIRNHPTVLEIYQNKLLESGQFSKRDFEKMHKKINSILQEAFDNTKDYIPKKPSWLSASWAGLKSPDDISPIRDTGVKPEILRQVGLAISSIPQDFKPHKGVKKIYDQRAQSIVTGEGIDWPLAEALAFGTLISEGNHVRMSGQDVERGTFSHRHAVIHDQETDEEYYPLGHVNKNQNKEMFSICNSSLSEFAVLGFELGYSMENPHSLVLWEAQFGDFANGGQVIIDNFLSSGEAKWLRQTGLVLLLPHGYDGQGPEHSSSRLERFLQMSDDDPDTIPEMSKQIQECNWQVVNVTTPANYFHVLRRQVHRDFRKPLIVMSPKNLLRHKDCKSHISEFDDVVGPTELDKQGTRFKRLIEDQSGHTEVEEGVSRLILCSGKVYYELNEERKKIDRKDVAICRVEQICPFPYDLIQRELNRYPRAEIVWCQEEPKNMGAYSYVAPRLYTAMKEIGRGSVDDIKYVGRGAAASPATGFHHTHVQQQAELIKKAMQSDPISSRSRTSL